MEKSLQQIQRQNQAMRLCQSKLAEVVAGVVPLTAQDDTPFDEDPNYTWSLEADNGTVTGLWNVTVTVKRQPMGSETLIQASLTQMVLDPTIIGNTGDVPPPPGTNMSTNGSESSTPSSNSGS